jgi:hypothetical protein
LGGEVVVCGSKSVPDNFDTSAIPGGRSRGLLIRPEAEHLQCTIKDGDYLRAKSATDGAVWGFERLDLIEKAVIVAFELKNNQRAEQ